MKRLFSPRFENNNSAMNVIDCELNYKLYGTTYHIQLCIVISVLRTTDLMIVKRTVWKFKYERAIMACARHNNIVL